jgi:hypothetical protein
VGNCEETDEEVTPAASVRIDPIHRIVAYIAVGVVTGRVAQRLDDGVDRSETTLAEMIRSSQRAISVYEAVGEYLPTAVVVELAKVLKVSTDELLGVKPLGAGRAAEDPEVGRLWKKFQQVLALPEKDRRAVIRLVNPLVAAEAAR